MLLVQIFWHLGNKVEEAQKPAEYDQPAKPDP